jgi:hypothetical protein
MPHKPNAKAPSGECFDMGALTHYASFQILYLIAMTDRRAPVCGLEQLDEAGSRLA